MAKKAKKRVRVSKELTRKQRSRLERERRLERWLTLGVTITGIAIVGVLGFGFVNEQVIKARRPVAVVAGTPITVAEFQARVRFRRQEVQTELQSWRLQLAEIDPTDESMSIYLDYVQGRIRELQLQLLPEQAGVLGAQVLEQMIQEELVRQEAERRDEIRVTQEEVQREIELSLGYDRNPATPTPEPTATPSLGPSEVVTATPTPAATPLPTPTPVTEEVFNQRYDNLKQALKDAGVSEQQYRSWLKVALLAQKLREEMSAEIPPTGEQVELRYLTVDSEESADELAARLDAGESFQTLVDELQEDEEATGYGGEWGWLLKSELERQFGEELANLAFDLEVGEHSQPVPGEDGAYYVIEVLGYEKERELDEWTRQQMANEAFEEWLEAQQVVVERKEYGDDIVPTEP
jgi:parvulin-like peptidyl-prolyl isomerase